MPHQAVPPAKRNFARSLRRTMTEAEGRLWQELRDRRLDGIKFRRQVPFGKYIADFVCIETSLIIEIDGSQHADSASDRSRDAELKARGFRVLRLWNDDVLKDMNAVCDTIIAYVRDTNLQPWR
ncbi:MULTISPECIES: endonuclease domain-containing protein [unclassified Mesorhizobium]|uniref:endonuclease domain-containing protein n=1 Tax=unclassified Mesorhizobium TaxID=325217 RepID=UPI000FD40FDE|nr:MULTISPECIES: endonuclease domain-containing protein [unclassified Mesorhizobium]RVD45711.1 endonuclease domain-containing protein [Mesorhizobium sp. M8A.F.Ca.ET.023.02.2.1]RWC65130.1 MAG: endonuclease domain-containing protein [Mesorhizobium sp.]RWF41279.1 MAG: endonuclease domain-containing protein [Mesorhizobium sp.]TGT80977.1 endonuclease domain-containing protein [Mesorhizobium sp. M8A.F.Ca.ET.161.01.1.1]TGV34573.1 endonuclease domain-containing protein [Mesorhizobium sp. M8A.F.Ca.ET.1